MGGAQRGPMLPSRKAGFNQRRCLASGEKAGIRQPSVKEAPAKVLLERVKFVMRKAAAAAFGGWRETACVDVVLAATHACRCVSVVGFDGRCPWLTYLEPGWFLPSGAR